VRLNVYTRCLYTIYHELIDKNKLDNNTKDIIEKFINKINYVDIPNTLIMTVGNMKTINNIKSMK